MARLPGEERRRRWHLQGRDARPPGRLKRCDRFARERRRSKAVVEQVKAMIERQLS
jgi:hypothetical protein